MQCNFTLYFFASSILCVFFEARVSLFDYFWKPNSPFSDTRVNFPSRWYFVFCKICALTDFDGACYYVRSLAALRVPGLCFWPARTRKNLELSELHTCLWPGAQIGFKLDWRKLVTASEGNGSQLLFYLIVLMGIVASVIGRSVFSYVSDLKMKFHRNALWRKRLQLDSKSNLSKTGTYMEFSARLILLSSTSYLYGLEYAWIA